MDLFSSTSLNGVWLAAVIQRHLFLSFFFLLMFNCLPTLLPVSAWLKPHGNKRQLELQPAKACAESGARFGVLVIFSWVWCVSSEWRCRDCAVSPQPRPGVLSGQHLNRKKQQKRTRVVHLSTAVTRPGTKVRFCYWCKDRKEEKGALSWYWGVYEVCVETDTYPVWLRACEQYSCSSPESNWQYAVDLFIE